VVVGARGGWRGRASICDVVNASRPQLDGTRQTRDKTQRRRRRVVCASETQPSNQTTHVLPLPWFTTRAKKAAIRKARGCVGSDGPPGFHILAPDGISHPCCSLQCVPKTHSHTHTPWPSTTRANGLAPTGQPMVPIARIPWLPAPVRRGREVEEESVEPKGGAAVLPCKGLDTCTPRRSKSSGLAPLLSDGPRAHDLWGQQKRCAAVEPSERLRPLRTSARGTGIINGFPDSTTLLCTSWTATFWLFRRCGGVLFQSSSSDRAAQETRVFAWPAVGGSSKPRSLHNTSAETETERETLMWTRDGEQFSPGGIGPENI
jgi:hypothetical protein